MHDHGHAGSHSLLKGPKHEIFESEFFTLIRPVGVDDLGTGEKNDISQVGAFI